MADAKRVTLETILSGEKYEPRPGTEYEVGEGAIVRLKRPYVGTVITWERVTKRAQQEGKTDEERFEATKQAMTDPDSDVYFLRLSVEKARACTVAENGFTWDLEAVDARVVKRINDDFFRLAVGMEA